MKKSFKKLSRFALLALLGAIMAVGCVPQKKIKYFQSMAGEENINQFEFAPRPDYKVKVGDNLYIKVQSLDEKTYKFFNYDDANRYGSTAYTEASIYLSSYTVNDSGYIQFPFVGKIQVEGLTVEQIKSKLQDIIDQYLKETTVVVKLVNFKITILGEVKNPGTYLIYQDRINMFEALSKAGDLTVFSNKNKVVLVRQTQKGAELHRISLTHKDFLESPYFYLLPNDIIYVEPLRGKQFAFADFPYTLLFSTITTTLLILNYFKK
ncbi:MAG: polysaccharide biosynthesis/export protein [Bacteroidales bacterium]|nr:polysaccharide biosynthesis/export protein [Bacteroidales bacterium]